ncbi:MAG: acyltransferase family protein [Alphaproteobacteria bacterium]|nr:acyltransferase family protein [Alphaproteobacteria bacterium]
MNRRLSIHLDALRAGAALIVMLSHWAYPRFTGGRYLAIRELNLGSDAVVLFFVLSGLVIAFSAEVKDRTAGRFLFNRATRLYSVAVPAVLLGLLLDRLGAHLNPAAYGGWWYDPTSIGDTLGYGLSFSNEWLLNGFRLGTNGPYWSLSYEVAYYLLFAAAVFLPVRLRIAALAAGVVLAGPRALFLMPAWLLGVLLWRLIRNDRFALSRPAAWLLAVVPPVAYVVALAAHLPRDLMDATQALLGLDALHVHVLLRFSDEFIWNWLIGALVFAHLAGVYALWRGTDRRQARETEPGASARLVRWVAGGSFSLYIIHYPVMQFLSSVIPAGVQGPVRDALLLLATLGVCLAFAELFERQLGRLRKMLRDAVGFLPGGAAAGAGR